MSWSASSRPQVPFYGMTQWPHADAQMWRSNASDKLSNLRFAPTMVEQPQIFIPVVDSARDSYIYRCIPHQNIHCRFTIVCLGTLSLAGNESAITCMLSVAIQPVFTARMIPRRSRQMSVEFKFDATFCRRGNTEDYHFRYLLTGSLLRTKELSTMGHLTTEHISVLVSAALVFDT